MSVPYDQIALTLISWVIGFFCGYLVRSNLGNKLGGTNGASFVLLVVACAWGGSVAFDIASSSYETPIAVHGLMGLIVGFFYKSNANNN